MTVLVGGVLTLLSVLIVPAVLVYGYVVRALRANLEGEPEPPTFGDWGELLVDGVKASVILLAYMLVPLVVMFVTVGGAVTAMATGGEMAPAMGAGSMTAGMLLTLVLAVAFGYLSAVGLVNFAREERLGAAFDADVIRDVGLDADFAVPWLLSVVVFVAASLLNVVPLVGALLSAFTGFYAWIVATRLWPDGFEKTLEGSDPTEWSDVGDPAA